MVRLCVTGTTLHRTRQGASCREPYSAMTRMSWPHTQAPYVPSA